MKKMMIGLKSRQFYSAINYFVSFTLINYFEQSFALEILELCRDSEMMLLRFVKVCLFYYQSDILSVITSANRNALSLTNL